MLASETMPTKAMSEALDHLKEISSQIQVAVVFDEEGKVEAASGTSDERAGRVAKASLELIREAERLQSSGKKIAQLDASTLEGSLFVVREGGKLIAAVTPSEPTVGLVFYDLKSCLRSGAGEKPKAPEAKSPAKTKPKTTKRAPARKSPSSGGRGGSRSSRKRDAES